jgi:hypothetical protein
MPAGRKPLAQPTWRRQGLSSRAREARRTQAGSTISRASARRLSGAEPSAWFEIVT